MPKFVKGLTFLLLAFTVGALSFSIPAQSAPRAGVEQASTELMARGELLKVDSTGQTFTIKQENDEEMQFQYNSSTKVEGSQNGVQGLSSETGTRVTVYYTEQSGAKIATKIEIIKGNG
jgi:lipopolysaccharide export LptBFGC system permease protein LptF